MKMMMVKIGKFLFSLKDIIGLKDYLLTVAFDVLFYIFFCNELFGLAFFSLFLSFYVGVIKPTPQESKKRKII